MDHGQIKQAQASEFLIAEYQKSWDMIFAIEDRRFKFGQYFTIVLGVLAIISKFIIDITTITFYTNILVTSFLALVILIGYAFIKILRSERNALIRYKRKINLIRGMFLHDTEDEKIESFLKRKDLGIVTDRDKEKDGHLVSSTGKTLKWVFIFMWAEISTVFIMMAYIWLAFFSII